MSQYANEVRDRKDLPFFAATIVSKPDFVVTGDKILREDMKRSNKIPTSKVLASAEFLVEIKSK